MSGRFNYTVSWSGDERKYVGRCVERPALVSRAATQPEALAGIMKLVSAGVAADTAAPGGVPARQYDGHLSLRVSPTLHARLAVEAAEQDVSVNEWAILKLTLDAGPLGPRRHADPPQC